MTTASMTASAGPNSAPPAPIFPNAAAAAFRRGPLIDIAAAPDTIGIELGRGRRRAHRRLHHHRRDRRRRPHRAGLSRPCRGRAWSRDAADPSSRHARRQSRAAFALLVFSQSAYRLPEEGRHRLSGRDGNHLYSVAFDLGPCVAPHPSTMAAALLAYDAEHHHRPAKRAVDRRTARRRLQRHRRPRARARRNDPEHRAAAAAAGERALYKRAISRSHAEWPLVEVCARAVVSDGTFQFIRITAGGIAPVPLRLSASEAALQGKPANAANHCRCREAGDRGAKPLPMTGYKLDLLRGSCAICWSGSRHRVSEAVIAPRSLEPGWYGWQSLRVTPTCLRPIYSSTNSSSSLTLGLCRCDIVLPSAQRSRHVRFARRA